MATLDPKLQTGVDFERVVETPSWVGGLAGLGTALIKVGAATKPARGKAADEARDQARLIGLQNSLTKAEEISLQGNPDKAERVRRTTIINFLRDGGEINDESKAIIKFTTGEDFETVAMSPQELAMNKFRKSEEYSGLIIASYSALEDDATTQQREQWAVGQYSRQQSYAVNIKNDSIAWYDGKQEAFNGVLEAFWHSGLGSLNAIVSGGGTVGQQDFQSVKAEWHQLKTGLLTRPQGITDSDWKPIEGKIKAIDETLTYLQTMSGSTGVTTELLSGLAGGIKQLVDEGKITSLDGIALLKLIEKDPASAVTDYGVTAPSKISEMLKSTTRVSTDSEDTIKSGEEGIPDGVKDQYSGIDPTTKLQDAKEITKATKLTNGFDLKSDKFAQNTFSEYVTKAFGAMNSVSADNNRFASVESINEVFNGDILAGINTIGVVDPVRAQRLANMGFEALDSQFAVASSALLNVASQVGLDPQNLVVTEELLQGVGMKPEKVAEARMMAEKFFGGDLNLMISSSPQSRLSKIDTRLGLLKSQVKQANDLKKTVARFDELRQVFLETSKSFVDAEEATGGNGTEQVEGGEAEDTLGTGGSNGPIAQRLGIDFGGYETQYGLPTGYLERMAMLESSGNPNAKAKDRGMTSSAEGLFQFIDSTAAQYGLTDKFDPVASTDAAARLAADNANSLRRVLGREPQAWELYLAHQQGAGGAAKLLSNPSGLAVDAVGKAAVINNGGHEGMTSGEFMRIWSNKWTQTSGRGPTSRQEALGPAATRPQARPDDLSTAVGIDRVRPQSRSEGLTGELEVSQGGTPTKEPKVSQEAAQEVLGTIAAEQKAFLVRIFGDENLLLEAIMDGTVDLKDVKGV